MWLHSHINIQTSTIILRPIMVVRLASKFVELYQFMSLSGENKLDRTQINFHGRVASTHIDSRVYKINVIFEKK
jgi:hypothetical protein